MKNNKYKKAVATLALMICVVFAGCSVNVDTPETTKESEAPTTAQNTTEGTTNVADTTLQASDVKLGVDDYDPTPIVWGPGNIENHQRPTDPVNLQNKFSELSGQWLLADDKNICLTIDEGYENGYTEQMLDTLKEKNVKAIFFCTYDYVRDNPEIVQRMIDEGHIVGNHSYSHYNMTEIDLATAKDEITLMHDYVKDNFDYDMKYFRFPSGEFSEQTLALAADVGYKSIFWSFAYEDWNADNPPDETEAFEKITSSTHNGAILLLHAVSSTNANILGDVIDEIQNQGYTFTTEL